IVSNLVRNAIKYMGDAKERIVRVRAVIDGSSLRIEVEDTGPGIAPQLHERVFEPYVQLQRGGARSGIGLGLATVKRLVIAHGGSLGIRSRLGAGSLFWVKLPIEKQSLLLASTEQPS